MISGLEVESTHPSMHLKGKKRISLARTRLITIKGDEELEVTRWHSGRNSEGKFLNGGEVTHWVISRNRDRYRNVLG